MPAAAMSSTTMSSTAAAMAAATAVAAAMPAPVGRMMVIGMAALALVIDPVAVVGAVEGVAVAVIAGVAVVTVMAPPVVALAGIVMVLLYRSRLPRSR